MKCILSGFGAHLDNSLGLFPEHRGTPLWTDGIESPSFIAVGDGYLFAITENRYYAEIFAFRKEGISYRLTDKRGVAGRELCHLVYSPKNRMLLGACYGTGHLIHAAFDPESGMFGEFGALQQQNSEDAQSRLHCIVLNKAEDRIYTVNLGLDQIVVYRLENGTLTEENTIPVKKGSGPRHAKLSADEKLLYVITEYSNEIIIYDTADWSVKQTVKTLPANYFGTSYCSTLCLSPDGRFVYAANRYADIISVMQVDENGLLTLVNTFDCDGRTPRHMEITPDGRDLVICCQDSDWVVFKRLNRETGMPTHTVREIPFLSPSCVAFVP